MKEPAKGEHFSLSLRTFPLLFSAFLRSRPGLSEFFYLYLHFLVAIYVIRTYVYKTLMALRHVTRVMRCSFE